MSEDNNTSLRQGHVAGRILAHAGAQCSRIDKALAIMHVLPAFEQPDTFNAILSRGFQKLTAKTALRLAVKHGHIHPVDLYPAATVAAETWGLLESATKFGNLPFLEKYFDAWIPQVQKREKIFVLYKLAFNGGQVQVLDWLKTSGRCHGEHIKQSHCTGKRYHLATLKWVKAAHFLDISNKTLLEKAREQNQPDVVAWAEELVQAEQAWKDRRQRDRQRWDDYFEARFNGDDDVEMPSCGDDSDEAVNHRREAMYYELERRSW
ncbi:hypothetical protein BC828DRAFT_404890 [Blastocladiella britannica]|nr:hypothetical protein BC828DRAFT_404890 [Blastocladiella britannica]